MVSKEAMIVAIIIFVTACVNGPYPLEEEEGPTHTGRTEEDLAVDSSTGIPFAYTFQYPINGLSTADGGFGFGMQNHTFCMASAPDGTCVSYGVHLGRDTPVGKTPVGTTVYAPADGIVRVTTDIRFGGYGSDSRRNAAYNGCVVVLEHLLGTGEAITSLLGHLECGSGPEVETLVARGDRIGRVGHYWHGADMSIDWHHVHWAIRKGRFRAAEYRKTDLLPYVQGYVSIAECKIDPVTGALTHPDWLDPFTILAANGAQSTSTDAKVRHHPSGSLLQDPGGTYWLVQNDTTIARIPSGIARNNRYATGDAIPVTYEEINCYNQTHDVVSDGLVTLYVRPGSSAVVMAYHDRQERYDLITWEAFLSWGFQEGDISDNVDTAYLEQVYRDQGFRLLRPGTLVKASEESEVSIITMQQTRLPIASKEAFERAGFKWNRITSIPKATITEVAGPREDRIFTEDDLFRCTAPSSCTEGTAVCGGGGLPEEEPEVLPPLEPQPEEENEDNEPAPEPEPESVSEPIPIPEPTPSIPREPDPILPEPTPPEEEPAPAPEPEPTSAAPPVLSSSRTIELRTLVDMDGFSLWLLSGSSYAMPEDTATECVIEARSASCTVSWDPARSLEFWMYTGVPGTPWSPGLNWETDVCDPFADVSVWDGAIPVPLQMIQVGDGCHFLLEGE